MLVLQSILNKKKSSKYVNVFSKITKKIKIDRSKETD